MKKLILVLLILSFFSCQSKKELTEPEKGRVIALGDSSATVLLKALVSSLKGALSSGGVVEGVEFCSKNAQTLTKSVEQGLPEGITVKRTTLKYRNEKNKPDEYDEKALKYYQDHWQEGPKNIPPYVQYVPEDGTYLYYKPLGIKKVCLNCHGSQQQINAEVRMRLKKYYVNDMATGYKEGDFRGLVRVSINEKLIKK